MPTNEIKKSIGQGFGKGEIYDVLKWLDKMPMDASITVSEKDTDEWYAYIQLKDWKGDDLGNVASVLVYLASDSSGKDVHEASVTTETAIKADGSIAVLAAKQAYMCVSEADGDIDLTITDTSADVYYVCVVLPTGKVVVSDAVTFKE